MSWSVENNGMKWCCGNACSWERCCAFVIQMLEVALTLGSGPGREECCDSNGVATLGAAAACEDSSSGICSILFNCVARVTISLRTESPGYTLEVVVEGGSE